MSLSSVKKNMFIYNSFLYTIYCLNLHLVQPFNYQNRRSQYQISFKIPAHSIHQSISSFYKFHPVVCVREPRKYFRMDNNRIFSSRIDLLFSFLPLKSYQIKELLPVGGFKIHAPKWICKPKNTVSH